MFRTTADTPKLQLESVTVRHAVAADQPALEELAILDSAPPLRGPALLAEADTLLLAALPLGSGRSIADPFKPTAAAVALLELRRQQLRAGEAAGSRLGSRLRRMLHPRTAHARA